MAKIVWKIDNKEVNEDHPLVVKSPMYKRMKENWDKINKEDGTIYVDSDLGRDIASSYVAGFSSEMKSFVETLLTNATIDPV